MKIGIIGPHQTIIDIQNTLNRNNLYVEPLFMEYKHYTDSIDILHERQKDVDAILFTGTTAFQYSLNFITPQCSWEYLPRNQISLLCALLKAEHQNKSDIRKISIDSYETNTVLECYSEIGFKSEEISIFRSDFSIFDDNYLDSLYKYHKNCYQFNDVSLCITGMEYVRKKLSEDNIPVIKVSPSKDILIEKINKLRLDHQLYINEINKTVCFSILLDELNEFSIYNKNELYKLRDNFKAQELIYMFAEQLKGAIINSNSNKYYILTDISSTKTVTKDFNYCPLLKSIYLRNIKRNIYVGMGIGVTSSQAKFNSEIAVSRCQNYHMSSMFVIYDDKKSAGPIIYEERNSSENPIDKKLFTISQKTKIGISTLFKIENTLKQHNLHKVTPKQLANLMEMTPRTINRLLLILEDFGYVTVVGKEVTASGRPSRIVQIHLND